MAEVNEELFEAVVRSGSFSREFNLRLKTKYILHERLVWLSVCNMALSVLHSKTDSCNCFHNFSFVSSLSDSFLFAFFFSHFYLLAIDGIFNAENGIRLEPIQLGMINRNGCVVAGNGTKKKKKTCRASIWFIEYTVSPLDIDDEKTPVGSGTVLECSLCDLRASSELNSIEQMMLSFATNE